VLHREFSSKKLNVILLSDEEGYRTPEYVVLPFSNMCPDDQGSEPRLLEFPHSE